MSTELSEYAADAIHGALFHGAEIAVPTELTVRIYATLPDRDGTGGVEIDYTSYAAQTVACGASSKWAAPSTASGRRVTSNSEAIEFPESTDTETQSAAGFAVFDGTDMLWLDTKAFDIAPGFQPIIAIGGMVFGFTAGAAASYELQDRVLNAFCRNTAFTALTAVEIEEYVTLPDKEDAGGTEASYTGYSSTSLVCDDETSDWDLPGDSAGFRMVSNTAAFDNGTENSSASQTITGVVLRDQTGDLLALMEYSEAQVIAVGTKITHKANSIRVRF